MIHACTCLGQSYNCANLVMMNIVDQVIGLSYQISIPDIRRTKQLIPIYFAYVTWVTTTGFFLLTLFL